MNKNYPFQRFLPTGNSNKNSELNPNNLTNLFQNSGFERITIYKNIEFTEIAYDVFSVTFSYEDITNLLRKIGFAIQAVYSDWNPTPFLKLKTKKNILVVKK